MADELVVTRAWVIPEGDLSERFSRSSGPGGQGVNTTDSRVELSYDVAGSPSVPDHLRARAIERLQTRLVDGVVTVVASEHRSQLRNREAARERLAQLLREAAAPAPPRRRPTRPTHGLEEAAARDEAAPRGDQAWPPGEVRGMRRERLAYGDDPCQHGTLHHPEGPSRGVVVVIHGGFWRAKYDASLGEPLAHDLARRGWTAWNLEYRRVGNGGGVAGHLRRRGCRHRPARRRRGARPLHRRHARPLRGRTPSHLGSGPGPVPPLAAGAGAGHRGDLPGRRPRPVGRRGGAARRRGGRGLPRAAGRSGYDVGRPGQSRAAGRPAVVRARVRRRRGAAISQSERYVEAAVAAGARAELVDRRGDHFTVIDTSSQAWRRTLEYPGRCSDAAAGWISGARCPRLAPQAVHRAWHDSGMSRPSLHTTASRGVPATGTPSTSSSG